MSKPPVLLSALRRLLDVVSAVLMLSIAALATLQVTARYVFGISTPWSEELLRLLFVAAVLLTAAFATHQRVDILDRAFHPKLQRALSIMASLFSCAMLCLMIYYGMDLVELTANDRYTALPLSVQWIYWALVVGCGLWLVRMIADMIWPPSAQGDVEL